MVRTVRILSITAKLLLALSFTLTPWAASPSRALSQDLDINKFVVPTDRDEALFLVNFVEYIAWDCWPGETAAIEDLQSWVDDFKSTLIRMRARATAENQPVAVQELMGHVIASMNEIDRFCKAAPDQKRRIREATESKRQEVIETLAEETINAIFERLGGNSQSLNDQRKRTSKNLLEKSKAGIRAAQTEEEQFEVWKRANIEAIQASRNSIEQQAIQSISVLAIQRNWKPGETRFDGSPILRGEPKVAARPRDPFTAWPFFVDRASNRTPFDAMGDAMLMYHRATYVPEKDDYKGLQVYYLGGALQLATNAAARSQSSYSSKPTFPSVAALQLSNRYIEKTTEKHPPEVKHVSNMARVAALNGQIDVALTLMEISENKPYCKNDPFFHLRYARMLSVANRKAESLERFHKYVTTGGTAFSEVKSDEDFKNLRTQIALNPFFEGVDLQALINP